jgi:hypothetical protein
MIDPKITDFIGYKKSGPGLESATDIQQFQPIASGASLAHYHVTE